MRKHSHFQTSLENPSIQTHLVLLCCIKRLCIFEPKGGIQIRYYYYYYLFSLTRILLSHNKRCCQPVPLCLQSHTHSSQSQQTLLSASAALSSVSHAFFSVTAHALISASVALPMALYKYVHDYDLVKHHNITLVTNTDIQSL